MKKILAIMAIILPSLTACAEHQRMIVYSELPAQAQTFIQRYFNSCAIAYIEREREGTHHDYNVHFENATEIEFDYQGNLKSVDCEICPVPNGIVPELVVNFVTLHYPNHFIVEYVIGQRNLTVELANGVELIFDLEGHFIRVDD